MENKKSGKMGLVIFLLVVAIIVIGVMGYFIYKIASEKELAETKIDKMNEDLTKYEEEILSLKEKVDLAEKVASETYYIEKVIMWSPNTKSYDFNTKTWRPNDSAEYYVATDKDKKLCIVDAEKNLVKKFDDIQIADLIISAYVAEWQNTLTIIQQDLTSYDIDITDFTYSQYQYASGY